MPNIVKSHGVNLTEEVFKIRDTSGHRPKPKNKMMVGADGEQPQVQLDENGQEIPLLDQGEDTGYYEDEKYSSPLRDDIIQAAMNEASQILKGAHQEAEELRNEVLLKANYEAERMKQAAEEEGKRVGYAASMGEMKTVAEELEKTIAGFEGDRAGFEAEYEQQLQWLALEIASKVLAKKVDKDDTEMVEMVQKAVNGVQNEAWIRVEVAQHMAGLIERLVQLYDSNPNITVTSIPGDTGTVMIETPSGVIDASLRTQLENLKSFFTAEGNAT